MPAIKQVAPTKDEAAQTLIEWHFEVEPETIEIYRIISADSEEAQDEPIKLLEVNEATMETGRVEAYAFGPAGDIPYPSVVALVTPEEMRDVREHRIDLPRGWDLESAHRYTQRRESHGAS